MSSACSIPAIAFCVVLGCCESILAADSVELKHVEVTQGVQDDNNAVPMIAGKRTFVRAFLEYKAGAPAQKVRGTIELRRSTGPVQTVDSMSTVATVLDPALNDKLDAKRRVLDRSLVFEIPADWTAPGEVSALLTGVTLNNGAQPACAKCNEKTIIKFASAAPVKIVLLGMRYTRGGKTFVPRDIDYKSIVSWMRRAYPASEFEFQIRVIDWTTVPPIFDGGLVSCGKANAVLTAFRKLDLSNGKNALFHYYGVVYYDGSSFGNFMRGCSSVPANPDPSAVGSGPAGVAEANLFPWDKSPSFAGWYAGHELGHTYGRHHPISGCGDVDETGGDQQWPANMPRNRLGTAENPYIAFDGGDPTIPVPMGVLGWDVAADLMTYCDHVWPSAHNYVELCNRISAENKVACPLTPVHAGPGPAPMAILSGPGGAISRPVSTLVTMADNQIGSSSLPQSPAAASPSGPVLSITGRIDVDSQTGEISAANRLERSVESPPDPSIPDAPLIRSYDSQGKLLSQMPAAILFDTDRPANSPRTGVVTGEVPYTNDIGRLELVYKDKTIAVRTSAAARPVITQPAVEPSSLKDLLKALGGINQFQFNIGPTASPFQVPGDFSKEAGALVYTWQNQGNTPVTYTVQISTNGGKDWSTVAVETSQHRITIDPSWIEGGSTLDVRVRASDGIHETFSTSKQLNLEAKIPLQ